MGTSKSVLLFAQLPERNGAGGSDIQRIDAVGHGDLDRVVAGSDGAGGEAVALGAKHDGKLRLSGKSLVVDAVLEQMKMCKAILIICDDKDPICDFVMRKLVRGATYTPCYGAYTDRPHYMIYTTLTHREALQLQAFIHKENLNAFISMLSTTEVFGKGFNHA